MAAPADGASNLDAQNQQAIQQQSIYPPLPPFYRLFRPDADGTAERPLPPAPPPPVEGTYQMFGELHTTESGVPPLQVRTLYQTRPDGSIDLKGELQRLNREVLFGFAELLDVLTERPSASARQLESLGIALRNQLHLCNLLRPHQARATLAHLLELEISEKEKAISDVREQIAEVQRKVRQSAEQLATLDSRHLEAAVAMNIE